MKVLMLVLQHVTKVVMMVLLTMAVLVVAKNV
jgi:hypothetical protein